VRIMNENKVLQIALLVVLVGFLVSTAALIIIATGGSARQPYDEAKTYAVSLVNNGLYSEAYDEFANILDNYKLSDRDAGSILFQMAEIAAERLHDSHRALADYLKIKQLYPNHPMIQDVERGIIAQLDKTGNSRQAQRSLEKMVELGRPASEVEPSQIVAKIGERAISKEDIENAIALLPAEIASQIANKQARSQFARSYVGQQLMFEAALREGYDSRPELIDALEQARREVFAQIYFKDNVASRVRVDPTDVEIFYEAHKEQFGGAPLEQIRDRVTEAARMEKMAGLQNELFDRLLEAEDVTFYPENL